MYGSNNDYLFACKCLMKTAPIITSLLLFGASIFIFGYMLRICERYFSVFEKINFLKDQ